jgi:sugar lactone lactonase YvrE
MDFAPDGFGGYRGQLFVADTGNFETPVKMTQPVTADGRVYRVTPDGQVHLVASGLFNPNGVRFVGNALWVTDVNGDFIVGKRELPDGFIVEIRARR